MRGDEPAALLAEIPDQLQIQGVTGELRAGKIQDVFAGLISLLGICGRQGGVGAEGIRQHERFAEPGILVGEHAPTGVGTVENVLDVGLRHGQVGEDVLIGIDVNEVVGLENPGVGGAAPEGDVIGHRVRGGQEIIAGIIQLIGGAVRIGDQIVGAGPGEQSPVKDDVVDEVHGQMVTQQRAGTVVVRIQIVVEAQGPAAITQQRAIARHDIGLVEAVRNHRPLHRDVGGIEHIQHRIGAPGGGDVVDHHVVGVGEGQGIARGEVHQSGVVVIEPGITHRHRLRIYSSGLTHRLRQPQLESSREGRGAMI